MSLQVFTLENAIGAQTLPDGGQTFIVGTAYFQPIYFGVNLGMLKSSDGGVTWANVGGAGPATNPPLGTILSATKIFVSGFTGAGVLQVHVFDTGANTWSTHVSALAPFTAVAFVPCPTFLRNDGVMIIGVAVANGPGGVLRSFFATFDTIGNTFSAALTPCGITSVGNNDDCAMYKIVQGSPASTVVFNFYSGPLGISASTVFTLWVQPMSGVTPGSLQSVFVEPSPAFVTPLPAASGDGSNILILSALSADGTMVRCFTAALPALVFSEVDVHAANTVQVVQAFQDGSTTTGTLAVIQDQATNVISFHNQFTTANPDGTAPLMNAGGRLYGPFTPDGVSCFTYVSGGTEFIMVGLTPAAAPVTGSITNGFISVQLSPALGLPDPRLKCTTIKAPILKGACEYANRQHK